MKEATLAACILFSPMYAICADKPVAKVEVTQPSKAVAKPAPVKEQTAASVTLRCDTTATMHFIVTPPPKK